MSDESSLKLFNKTVVQEPSSGVFLLTGIRQLLRVLDIGLVVPELVACDGECIAQFTEASLPTLQSIQGYPVVPVLLELKTDVNSGNNVYPASAIKAIHFESTDALEDYQARGFQNVPNGLFDFSVIAALFEQGQGDESTAILAKMDRKGLKEHYRRHDVFAGLLRICILQSEKAAPLREQLELAASKSRDDDISGLFDAWVQTCIADDLLNAADAALLTSYLQELSERDIDEGWSSIEVLEALADRIPDASKTLESFQKWYQYSKAVISNEKELLNLTDEGDIGLRAMLLHLLNPDVEAVERMAQRDPAPGPKVLAMATTLAATRLGFAPLDAADKQSFPGAYYLVSDLVAAFINRQPFDLGALEQTETSEGAITLNWHGELVNQFSAIQSVENEAEEGIQESPQTYLSLSDIEAVAKGLEGVGTAEIDDGQLILSLTRAAVKPLPKQATFSLILSGQVVLFTSRLLDLSVKSQKAKLTGKRMMAALIYQTGQGRDFRFNTIDGDHFSAQISLPEPIDQSGLQTALQRLFDCHTWMKTTIK